MHLTNHIQLKNHRFDGGGPGAISDKVTPRVSSCQNIVPTSIIGTWRGGGGLGMYRTSVNRFYTKFDTRQVLRRLCFHFCLNQS
jgi:hypothetical protein